MATASELEVQLEVVKLEEKWVKAKKAKGFDRNSPENRRLRKELKDARKEARKQREAE